MQIDIRHTAQKVRDFGGKWHIRAKGNDAEKRALLQRKCDELKIAPVIEGQF